VKQRRICDLEEYTWYCED